MVHNRRINGFVEPQVEPDRGWGTRVGRVSSIQGQTCVVHTRPDVCRPYKARRAVPRAELKLVKLILLLKQHSSGSEVEKTE